VIIKPFVEHDVDEGNSCGNMFLICLQLLNNT